MSRRERCARGPCRCSPRARGRAGARAASLAAAPRSAVSSAPILAQSLACGQGSQLSGHGRASHACPAVAILTSSCSLESFVPRPVPTEAPFCAPLVELESMHLDYAVTATQPDVSAADAERAIDDGQPGRDVLGKTRPVRQPC